MVVVQTVKAQGLSIDLEFVSSPPAYVNQPFEIAATVSGGTPPYTYQWYTKWFPPWEPGMDPEQYRASSGSEIAVPGATSATFWFTPTVEGVYWISVGISDSAGTNCITLSIYSAIPAYRSQPRSSAITLSIPDFLLCRQSSHFCPQRTRTTPQMPYG